MKLDEKQTWADILDSDIIPGKELGYCCNKCGSYEDGIDDLDGLCSECYNNEPVFYWKD
ncbi:hypothetical protein JW949_00325 [Candidatus Woesearchaeota archaeon]|nr:hypothetical protein [Candidatus Woesearchaeota archaeon]